METQKIAKISIRQNAKTLKLVLAINSNLKVYIIGVSLCTFQFTRPRQWDPGWLEAVHDLCYQYERSYGRYLYNPHPGQVVLDAEAVRSVTGAAANSSVQDGSTGALSI